MKVCCLPKELPAPEFEYSGEAHELNAHQAKEDAHSAALKVLLISKGYKGKHTGEIYRSQIADGFACYMFADAGAQSCLIHLPYGDGYNDMDVAHVPKTVILQRIEADKRMSALFDEARAKQKA